MSSDQSASRIGASSSEAQSLGDESPSSPVQPPDQHDPQTHKTLSYVAKGKARASDEDLAASLDHAAQHIQHAMNQLSISTTQQTSQPAEPTRRRTRKGRDTTSRSVAPIPLRSPLVTSPTTGEASQFVSLLGQPVAVSASLSASDKPSATAASAALPSLYKASRGRSANVSPSRRWDRRGASASVLSGASASGSGGEGDDASEEEPVIPQPHRRTARPLHRSSPLRNSQAIDDKASQRLSIAKEEALFPSDEDDSPLLSSTEDLDTTHGNRNAHRRRSRRWSSIERERRRACASSCSNALPTRKTRLCHPHHASSLPPVNVLVRPAISVAPATTTHPTLSRRLLPALQAAASSATVTMRQRPRLLTSRSAPLAPPLSVRASPTLPRTVPRVTTTFPLPLTEAIVPHLLSPHLPPRSFSEVHPALPPSSHWCPSPSRQSRTLSVTSSTASRT